MAPKRPPPIEQPPSASSSEGEEESEEEVSEEEHREDENRTNAQSDVEEEESEDEEEEEEEQVFKKSSGQKAGAKSPPSEDSDSEESDSEQTQPSPSASDFTVKPIVSKPMEDSPAKKPFNKPPPSGSKHIVSNQTDELTKPKKGSAKRTVESGQNGKDSQKKSKVSNGDEEDRAVEEKKTGAINRLWSEDDEIAILRGIIEYSKTGGDIHSDMAAFHESIKKSLHVDVSKSQLMDKIRRLKKKYQVNSGRGQKGEDPVFSKLHEHKAFELSKKIWGDGGSNAVDDGAKSSSKRAKTSVPQRSPIVEALIPTMKAAKGKAAANKASKEALKVADDRKIGKRKAAAKASKSSKRQAKGKKDPNKPKRPPSAFFVFLEEFRKTFKKEHPNVKAVSAVGKAGGERWKSMSPAEKEPYEAKAAKRKSEYEKQMNAYNKKQESTADEVDEESDRSKSEVNDEDEESEQEEEEEEEDEDDD